MAPPGAYCLTKANRFAERCCVNSGNIASALSRIETQAAISGFAMAVPHGRYPKVLCSLLAN